jgi:phenylacetate-CoA ligase
LYEIVGTSLWNLTMPLVRYRTGDLLLLPREWGPEELAQVTCGTRSFGGVLGRDQEVLLGPQGLKLTGVNQIPRDVKHVLRVQLVQEALDTVRILVLPAAGYGHSDEQVLLRNARAKLPASMQVRVEVVEMLERTARGKTPFVIHRPPVREALLRAS